MNFKTEWLGSQVEHSVTLAASTAPRGGRVVT